MKTTSANVLITDKVSGNTKTILVDFGDMNTKDERMRYLLNLEEQWMRNRDPNNVTIDDREAVRIATMLH